MCFDKRPKATASIKGGPLRPKINGTAWFFDAPEGGTYLLVKIEGLPPYQPATIDHPPIGPHGFHIHSGCICTVGDPKKPFLEAGEHYNPDNQPHGNHVGDLPVLFSMNGLAILLFYSNRFKPHEVIGRTLIIHENPDDFRSQPAGNSGLRLACGEIKKFDCL